MSVPLIFKTLTLKNFMSFGNSESTIELAEQGTVTITGENIDQGGSNGSGKTTIINALCYALYNKAFDAITLQRLINTTNSLKNTSMEVRLTFEKDGCEYEVFRARGAEYKIEILKDGEDITPGKGAVECDALLVDIIGISYELFTKTIIFSGNSPAFLQLPLFQQRNQIEELFNITMLSEKATILKEKIKSTEQDIKVQEAICKQQEGALELHKKHVAEANTRVTRWEKQRTDEITEIEETLLIVGQIDFDAEKKLHAERASLKEQGAYLAAKLAPKRKDFKTLSAKVEELMREHDHLADAKCPYCSQAFANAAEKLSEVDAGIESRGARVLELEGEITELDAKATEFKTRLGEVERGIQYQELDELLAARDNAKGLRKKAEELKVASNPHIEARDKLVSEATSSVDYLKVDALRKRLDHQQFLLKLLTDKNSFLRRRIINKTIPFLNARLNHFTSTLGLPHVVKFDADMSCTVAEFGRELDFGNLSAGEKKRVNTAMALAFRDVLHHLHAKTNLLVIDELDGALDQQGIDSIVRILKEKSRDEDLSVFVISHHPSIVGRLDKNVTVRKENGFSMFFDE
jgi:DNA repair exonuclease SbcCD ATPase subunit